MAFDVVTDLPELVLALQALGIVQQRVFRTGSSLPAVPAAGIAFFVLDGSPEKLYTALNDSGGTRRWKEVARGIDA
jgi:hypothetical protein